MSADGVEADAARGATRKPGFDRAKMSARADMIAQQLSALKGARTRIEPEAAPQDVSESPAPPAQQPSAAPARWELTVPPDLQRALDAEDEALTRHADSRRLALLAGAIAVMVAGGSWAYLRTHPTPDQQEAATALPAPAPTSGNGPSPAAQSSAQPVPAAQAPSNAAKQTRALPTADLPANESPMTERERLGAAPKEPSKGEANEMAAPARAATKPAARDSTHDSGTPPDPMKALLKELQVASPPAEETPAAKTTSSAAKPAGTPMGEAPPPALQPDQVLKLPPNASSTGAPPPGAKPFVPAPQPRAKVFVPSSPMPMQTPQSQGAAGGP